MRQVPDEDLEEVLARDRECFPGDPPPSTLELAYTTWWTDEDAHFGLYEPAQDGPCFLLRYGVLPRAQGAGKGRQCALRALRAARRRGRTAMVTYVLISNVASLRALLGVGFRPTHWNTNTLWLVRDLTQTIPRR